MSKGIEKEDRVSSDVEADLSVLVRVPVVVEGEVVGHVEYTWKEYERVRRRCEEHGLTPRELVLMDMPSEGARAEE